MAFETLYHRIAPRLKKMAHYYNGHGRFIDGDDLYQEMCAYLWARYPNGAPEGINDAYVIKGCEFHVRNYLRKAKNPVEITSLNLPIGDGGITIADLIPDKGEPVRDVINRRLVADAVRNSGLTLREQEVFSQLADGYTVREIGQRMGISHVMVLKIKKSLLRKWQEQHC